MGIRWHYLAAKFKQRLSLSDLHDATDHTFESSTTALPDMFHALRESEPEADHGRIWRNDFSQKLEIIAAEQTRQSQAAECRKLLIKSTEDHALAVALVGTEALVSRMFFEEEVTSDMSDEMVRVMVAKCTVFRLVDKVALMTLYDQQFNSTLHLDDFDDDYSNISKLSAEFTWREVSHNLLSSMNYEREEGWDKFYVEIVHPASTELSPIKRKFEENLCLLSPKKPDAKAFYEFKERALKAMKPYL